MKKKQLSVLKTFGLIAALFVFCMTIMTPAVFAADTIKIGAVFSVTGPASWLGEPEANMARMVVDEVNAQGGIRGQQIELIIKDTQGDPERTRNAVRELIRERVVAIIGPSRSGSSMAVVDLCERAQIPLVSCAALAQITDLPDGGVRNWVFKTPHKDSHVVQRIYEYMQEKGMKKVALITGTTGFGAGGRAKLIEEAPKYGIQVVADETYGPKETDMTVQLTKIKQADPDALINWSIVPGQSIMMKNMKQLGMDVQLFQSHGFGNYGYLKAAGDAANGVIFPAGRALVADQLPEGHEQKELLEKLKKDYEAKYDEPLSTFAGHSYDAIMLVITAIKKGDGSRKSIRDELEGINGFVGTGGVFSFSENDHTGLSPESLQMLTVKDGKFAILEQ
ncbi:MAG: ABC transporter substrate-binding protein [Candidatus Sumerlaeota bacterium]